MGRQSQAFGQLLRGFRLSAGLTQRELAERAGGQRAGTARHRAGSRPAPPCPVRATVRRRAGAGRPGPARAAGQCRRGRPAAGAAGDPDRSSGGRGAGPAGGAAGAAPRSTSSRTGCGTCWGCSRSSRTAPSPSARFIDVLWPASPPATARRLVQSYAGKLRALLQSGPDPPAGEVLAGTRAGFRLGARRRTSGPRPLRRAGRARPSASWTPATGPARSSCSARRWRAGADPCSRTPIRGCASIRRRWPRRSGTSRCRCRSPISPSSWATTSRRWSRCARSPPRSRCTRG